MKPIRFPEFDGLRATAALMVFGFHAWFIGLPVSDRLDWSSRLPSWGPRLLDSSIENLGPQGVALFYVISGFLLYRPFLAARASGTERSPLGGYLIRRGARIFPAYWAALTIVGLLQDSKGLFTLSGVWDYYLFNHIYSSATLYGNPIPSGWTLGVELSFYVFLALWVAVSDRLNLQRGDWFGRELTALSSLAAVSFGWLIWTLLDPSSSPRAFQPRLVALPASLYVFAAGMALAAISVRVTEDHAARDSAAARFASFLSRRGWLIALTALFLMSVYGALPGFGSGNWEGPVLVDSTLKVVTAVGLVGPAIFRAERRTIPLRLLGSRVALYLGLVSYGIYIWQLFVMERLFRGGRFHLELPTLWTFPAATALALGATTLIATASWFLLEKRVIRWAAALSGREGGERRVAR
ncbi:MAG: acyltransferase [Actinomycetes bacterium]